VLDPDPSQRLSAHELGAALARARIFEQPGEAARTSSSSTEFSIAPLDDDLEERLAQTQSPHSAPAWDVGAPVFFESPCEQGPRVPFVGRGRERALLEEALTEGEAGQVRAVRIRALSGMGKTELAQRFVEACRERARVLVGRCHLQESIPYKALDPLMDAFSRELGRDDPGWFDEADPHDLAALLTLFPVLGRTPGLKRRRSHERWTDHEQLRQAALRAWRVLLGGWAQGRPVILWIDDLQWADEDSLGILVRLLAQADGIKLLLLSCSRSEDEARSPALAYLRRAGDSFPEGRVTEVDLEPLSLDDGTALAADWLGCRPGDLRSERVAKEAAGSPFFVGELARYWASGSARDVEAHVTFQDAMLARLAGLTEADRHVLHLVSVSAQPLELHVALRAAYVDAAWGLRLPELRDRCILRTTARSGAEALDTYHAKIREAVLADLPEPRRRELHRTLAESLELEPKRELGRLARHFRDAGDNAKAFDYAVRAGDQASETLAFNRAAELYDVALVAQNPSEETWRLRAKRGHALAHAGRCPEAARDFEQAAAAVSIGPTMRLQRLSLLRQAAEQWLRGGVVDKGVHLLREVLDQCDVPYPKTSLGAVGVILASRALVRARGGFPRRLEERQGQATDADLERVDACFAAALGLNFHDFIRSAAFQLWHSVWALRAGEPTRLLRAITVEAVFLAGEGRARGRAESARLLERALTFSHERQDSDGLAFTHLCAGIGHVFAGRWADALLRLDESERIYRSIRDGVVWETLNCQMYRSWVQWYLGDLKALRGSIPELVAATRARGDVTAFGVLGTGHANAIWLADDDPEQALRQTNQAVEPFPEARLCSAPRLFHFVAAVNAELYRGEGPAAWERVRRAWPSFRRVGFFRLQFFRSELLFLRARAALAAAGHASGTWASARLLRRAGTD
ncbi:MAG: ATP-binding protein, partial [Planctomycetota bacterium]